jgi:hypothetical protein
MLKQDFCEALKGVGRWATIKELVNACDRAGYWDEEFLTEVAYKAKAAHVRRMIRQDKDENGWPHWHSVETTNEEGETVRVYKQEELFDVNDYAQTINYYVQVVKKAKRTANQLARNAIARFGRHRQLYIPFSDDDEGEDSPGEN